MPCTFPKSPGLVQVAIFRPLILKEMSEGQISLMPGASELISSDIVI